MKFEIGDKVLHTVFNEVATVIDEIDNDGMLRIEFDRPFDDILPCNYKSYWTFPERLRLIKRATEVALSTLRDPENGAIGECQVPYEFTVEPATPAPPNYYDKHYDGAIQPIELMQLILTPEEFKGFLKGNIIKYTMRCGKKDAPEKEFTKIRRYKQWLDLAEEGITIDPRV